MLRLFGISLLCCLCLPMALAQDIDPAQDDDVRQRLDQVRERIGTLKQKIDRDQRRRGDLSQTLARAEKDIAAVSRRLRDSRRAIEERQRSIARLDIKRSQQSKALEAQLDQLSRQVRAAYRTGQQGKLRLLFAQEDPARLGRMLVYHDYYAQAQSNEIAAIREDIGALLATRSQIEAQRKVLQAEQQDQQQLLASLRNSQSEREKSLQAVEKALSGSGRQLKNLLEDEQQLQGLIESVRTRLADIPAPAPKTTFKKAKGRLAAPVQGRVIASFGQSKAGGPLKWKGIWLGANAGTPVRAAASGRVVYVGHMHRYGLIVVLDHGNDFYTVYGHTQSAYVEVGQSVAPGATIAAAGNSGGHKTTGVYFEVRQGRKPVDPAAWLGSG